MTKPLYQLGRIVRLQGRHTAPEEFYEEVIRQAIQLVRIRKYKKEYKSERFVEPAFWGTDVGIHQLIGRCIAHGVATGRIALRFAGCPRCSNKRYLRI